MSYPRRRSGAFDPKSLLSEALFHKIDDSNWERAFELMKAGGAEKWALLRGPLGWLAAAAAVLLAGTFSSSAIALAAGGILSAYFLYRLALTGVVLRRIPEANARMRDYLALIALEKRAGTDWTAFSAAHAEPWSPEKVRTRIAALAAAAARQPATP